MYILNLFSRSVILILTHLICELSKVPWGFSIAMHIRRLEWLRIGPVWFWSLHWFYGFSKMYSIHFLHFLLLLIFVLFLQCILVLVIIDPRWTNWLTTAMLFISFSRFWLLLALSIPMILIFSLFILTFTDVFLFYLIFDIIPLRS